MTKNVPYKKKVNFLGRNGYFKQSGLDVHVFDGIVQLTPITSRGNLARCHVEIPIENVPALMSALFDCLPEKCFR